MNPNPNIQTLWEEVRELTFGTTPQIDRLHTPPTPLHFLRHYLSQNKPFILSPSFSSTLQWPATTLWTSTSYLLNTLSSSTVSLHLTPTGHADSLTPLPNNPNNNPHNFNNLNNLNNLNSPNNLNDPNNFNNPNSFNNPNNLNNPNNFNNPKNSNKLCFASADVKRTLFSDAIDFIVKSDLKKGVVAYAQQQNDCFRGEYGALAGDCDAHVAWATEAVGGFPEAVNLWIGNELSETSFHKDHYENVYAVVTGEKHFLLLPPTDVHRMYIREYPAARYNYSEETGEFKLEVEDPPRYVPWCSVNPYPLPENLEKEMSEFPLYYNGPKPFEVTVKAGEILYLPSMWFHHVRQTPDSRGLTIAVNYWYDMRFDIKYAYFNFLQSFPAPQEPTSPDPLTNENASEGDEQNREKSAFSISTL